MREFYDEQDHCKRVKGWKFARMFRKDINVAKMSVYVAQLRTFGKF